MAMGKRKEVCGVSHRLTRRKAFVVVLFVELDDIVERAHRTFIEGL